MLPFLVPCVVFSTQGWHLTLRVVIWDLDSGSSQVQILAVPLSGGCSLGRSQTRFGLPTYSFLDLLLMRAPLLRILHSTKWGECHRHSQPFLGYAERDSSAPVNSCAVFLLPLWPSHSLGFCLCLFFSPAGFASPAVFACVIASHQSPL